jgi:hypothetical protein
MDPYYGLSLHYTTLVTRHSGLCTTRKATGLRLGESVFTRLDIKLKVKLKYIVSQVRWSF